MKFLLLTILVSAGVGAQTKGYSPNNGVNPPGTFESKDVNPMPKNQKTTTATTSEILQEEQASPMHSQTGINNSSGVTTDQMNTSPNTPPTSDKDVIDDTTLSTGPVKDPRRPAEIQAMDEENALDYSTTPQKNKKSEKDVKKVKNQKK
jgi:hypothetical protein